MYGRYGQDAGASLAAVFEASTNNQETSEKLAPYIDKRHHAGLDKLCAARTWIASQAGLNPGLGTKLAPEQERITSEIPAIFEQFQTRGWAYLDWTRGQSPYLFRLSA